MIQEFEVYLKDGVIHILFRLYMLIIGGGTVLQGFQVPMDSFPPILILIFAALFIEALIFLLRYYLVIKPRKKKNI